MALSWSLTGTITVPTWLMLVLVLVSLICSSCWCLIWICLLCDYLYRLLGHRNSSVALGPSRCIVGRVTRRAPVERQYCDRERPSSFEPQRDCNPPLWDPRGRW